jgi:hypothetical protein
MSDSRPPVSGEPRPSRISRRELVASLMSERLARVIRPDGSWEWWADNPDAFASAIFDAIPERHDPSPSVWGLRGQVIRGRIGGAHDD